MQVLGDLIKFPEDDPDSLPIPWWHRAPLGFFNGTSVFLALMRKERRPIGDLIVSVLDPGQWNNLIYLECKKEDEPGVLADVCKAAFPLNIALSESVTVDSGTMHHLALAIEPLSGQETDHSTHIRTMLEMNGFQILRLEHFSSGQSFGWSDTGWISYGWVKGTNWRTTILKQLEASNNTDKLDLTRAVISADTETRAVRYLFPKRGARTIEIQHADVPGALEELTQAILDCRLNILSALLRRGGAKPRNAVLVAVCEPSYEANTIEIADIEKTIFDQISRIHHQFRPSIKINDGVDARATIYPRQPDAVIATVPEYLGPVVLNDKRKIPKEKIPVFLSRRFVSTHDRTSRIVNRVHKVLRDHNCEPVEALPQEGQFAPTFFQVSSKMWVSKAGIVLVTGGDDQGSSTFNINLAHEAGFLQGQGKPVLFLVEGGPSISMAWANLQGVNFSYFASNDRAFDPDNQQSIDRILSAWVTSLRR